MPRPTNPLQQYREAQRALRELFEPFTATHCPGCLTPCCVKPTWVRPSDLILVEELGYSVPATDAGRPAGALLTLLVQGESAEAGQPCDFLQGQGCTFPPDLRPFGCAASICAPMRQILSVDDLTKLEGAVAKLTTAHQQLTQALLSPTHPSGSTQ